MDRPALRAQLVAHEGVRRKPYTDTVGKVTIGVGRNLTDRGLSDSEVTMLFENDISLCESELDARLPWWRNLDETRQHVLLDMCFNLGITKLMEFKRTLAYVEKGWFDLAAEAMLASRWADQVGARADRLAKMMHTGGNPFKSIPFHNNPAAPKDI